MGNGNKSQDASGIMVGFSNELMDGFSSGGVVFGSSNKTYANVVVGRDNSESTGSRSYSSVILGRNCIIKDATYTLYCGWGLTTPTNNSSVCLFGKYNGLTYSLNNPSVIFGCGTDSSNRKNALECNATTVKIAQNLQLKTDTTEVNAITPPQDPNNVTQDDMTLVTVSHLNSFSSGIMKQEQHRLTVQPDLRYGTGQNITTDLGLTVPDWATEVILRIRIVDADNFEYPMTRRYNITIPIQPSDVSATWRGNLNIALPVLSNSIWTVVYYSGEFAIYQNVLQLEHAVDVKVVQGTPPTITVANSTTSFFLEGMDFKGVL